MKKKYYLLFIAVLMAFAGCESVFYGVYNDFTGPVTGVYIKKTTSIVLDGTEQFHAAVFPALTENRNVTWSVTDGTGQVTVDDNGLVTGKAVGTATLTVTTEEGVKTASCDVTVTDKPVPVSGVTLDKTSLTMAAGDSYVLTTVFDQDPKPTNQNVSWKSNNTTVADVNAAGLVYAKAQGTATITVTTADGSYTEDCIVTVNPPVAVTGVTLDTTTCTTAKVVSFQLTATVSPSDASNKTVVWNSTDESVATVSDTGYVSVVGAGSGTGAAVITVTTQSGLKQAACTIQANGYTVTYNGNHYTGGTVPSDSLKYLEGQAFTTTSRGTMIYVDRNLLAWSTVSEGSGTEYVIGQNVTMGAANITLYAKWQVFALRDIGPGGGYVFYDSGSYGTKGWRYLEAAPASCGDPQMNWMPYSTTYIELGCSATGIGYGKTNTDTIITQTANADTAAKYCRSYTGGGFNDWFMPSSEELREMNVVLKQSGVGGFVTSGAQNQCYYLSSSEEYVSSQSNWSGVKMWSFQFDGISTTGNKYVSTGAVFRVRPVRAF